MTPAAMNIQLMTVIERGRLFIRLFKAFVNLPRELPIALATLGPHPAAAHILECILILSSGRLRRSASGRLHDQCWRTLNAMVFGSGEARRGSIPRSGAVTEKQGSQN